MTDAETKLLRRRWAAMRGTMAPEWATDFEAFRAWCEKGGWTPEHKVTKKHRGKPLGPDNAQLTAILICDRPLEKVKPGWKNRPCVGCPYEARQTYGSCPCRAYWDWWNVTMAAYRRALMGKADAMERVAKHYKAQRDAAVKQLRKLGDCSTCAKDNPCGYDGPERTAWIPCSERLPEPDNLVLAIVSGKPCENITLVMTYQLAEIIDDGWWIDGYPEWQGATVTHWMPLPEPPEESV